MGQSSVNWKQLYASATPEERLEFATLMIQYIEARQNKFILAKGRLINDRRGAFRGAHFIRDRRGRELRRRTIMSGFIFILMTVSFAVWISFFHLPPVYAAPLMLLHLASLAAILVIKPYSWPFARSTHLARS